MWETGERGLGIKTYAENLLLHEQYRCGYRAPATKTVKRTLMEDITISVHAAIAEAFRGIPEGKQERYRAVFARLFVEGAAIDQFVEEVMADLNGAAARGELTPVMLMHLIDESYEDLLSHQGADLAEAEGGESVPWDEVKRELGL